MWPLPLTYKIAAPTVALVTAIELTDLDSIPGYGAFGGAMLVAWRILSKALRDSTDEYKDLTNFYREEIARLQARVRELEER